MATSQRHSFSIPLLLISAFCCIHVAQCNTTITTETTKSTPGPTLPTTTTTTTLKPTTTPAPTLAPTTTTPTTTTSLPPITTTEPSATLGDNCSGRDSAWCIRYIAGSECDNTTSQCVCSNNYVRLNNSFCLTSTLLIPTDLTFDEANITSSSLVARWQMAEALSWKFNVTCTGVQSSFTETKPGLNVNQASFTGLTPGDQYNVSVTACITSDIAELHCRTKTNMQAIDPAMPGHVNVSIEYVAPDFTLQWISSEGYVDLYWVSFNGTDRNTTNNYPQMSLTGLMAGTTYNVNITALTHGRKSVVRTDQFTTRVAAPGPPQNLRYNSTAQTSIKLHWEQPTNPNGNLTGYFICYYGKVYQDLTDYSSSDCRNVGNVNQFEVDSLTQGAFYDFMVYSTNTDYNSSTSANLTAVRTLQAVPGYVQSLDVTVNNLSFIVTWQRPATPNGDIIQYVIEWRSNHMNCSDCLTTSGTNCTEILQESDNCSKTGENIVKNQKSMTYTISGLSPFTNYSVTITPYTNEGPGHSNTTTATTSTVKPHPVTDVVTKVLSPTAVMVNWTIPDQDPGPVNYTVYYFDMILDSGTMTANQGCSVEGYHLSSCVVTGLEEYWVYQFAVEASTTAGSSEPTYSGNATTLEGNPEQAQDFRVEMFNTSIYCDATKVVYHWTEPGLRTRNAKIVEYIITDTTQNMVEVNHLVNNPEPYSSTNRTFTETFTELTAETTYHKQIQAVTNGNVRGASSPITFTMGSCAPPAWPASAKIEEKSGGKTQNSFTVTLQRHFFVNTKQGNISETGLIISKQNYSANQIEIDGLKKATWSKSKESGFQYPYSFTIKIPDSNSFEIIVGQNTTCSMDVSCNGQLPANKKFYVMAYACTSDDKCTGSPFYGAYATADIPVPPESSSPGPAIAGVIIGLGLIILIVAVVFLHRRGTINITKHLPCKPDDDGISIDLPIETKHPVRFSVFDKHVQDLHKDTNLLFSSQYDDIQKLSKFVYDSHTTDAANLEDNKPKNRWVNILPFDDSRVKLQQLDDDDPTSDYINANYIPGFKHQREYIATQGPLPGTIDDFWRMVWEHNVAIIVMLTQCKEGNRGAEMMVKCENYWPTEVHEPKQYGDVVVDPVSISTMNKYNISIFEVSVDDVKRRVHHFHYLEFLDMSANVEYDIFLEFLKVVRSHAPRNSDSPMVVHCSAGVGRTGTFIVLDRLQQTLSSKAFSWDDKVDIFDMVMEMRNHRTNMIQTESQYVMIHDCLCKMLEEKKRSTEMSNNDESLYVNQAYDPYREVLYENVKGNDMKTDL